MKDDIVKPKRKEPKLESEEEKEEEDEKDEVIATILI